MESSPPNATMPLHLLPLQKVGQDGKKEDLPVGLIVATDEDATEAPSLEAMRDIANYSAGRPLNRSEFIGGPLKEDEIRLVTLAPSQRVPSAEDVRPFWEIQDPEYPWKIGGPLKDTRVQALFRIDVVNINQAPPYEALSYTWNDFYRQSMIMNASTLMMTGNLSLALRQLQHETQPRVLWIDALCINQDDDEEKGRQVLLMTQIYSRAELVIIWLGEADQHTQLAFDSFAKRAAEFEANKFSDPLSYPLSESASKELDAVHATMDRAYFSRVWIIQEVVVAKAAKVVCGEYEMDFEPFALGARWYCINAPSHAAAQGQVTNTLSNGQRVIMDVLLPCQRAYRSGEDSPALNLEHLLFFCRNSKATNPLDYIYAFTGFVSNLSSEEAEPPCYSKSPEVLYTETMRRILLSTGNLDMLCAVQKAGNESKQLPSWVPDWRTPWRLELLGGPGLFLGPPLFNASCGRKAAFFDDGDPTHLGIAGFALDRVTKLLNPWNGLGGRNMTEFWFGDSQMKDICEMQGLEAEYKFGGEPIQKAYLRTLGVDQLPDSRLYLRPDIDPPMTWRGWFQWLMDGHEVDETYTESMPLEIRSEIMWHIMRYTRGRMLFVTDGGSIGLGPDSMREGDSVVIFRGASVPFVIRGEGPTNSELIGECYLHGFMEGHFAAYVERQGAQPQVFFLK